MSQLPPNATTALRDILDGAHGPVAPPIRAEIFGPERFAQHGRSLAAAHSTSTARQGSGSFFPRLRSNIAVLRQANRYIGLRAATDYDTSPAAQWLLDNFHLIESQLHEVHEGLPRSYFRSLPVLLDPPLEGLPRVYGIAWAFVAHTDGAFDEDLLVDFLLAYQEVRQLDLREMWALPTTLRVVLIENLRRLAEREARNEAAREAANLCGDHITTTPVAQLEQWRAQLAPLAMAPAFLARLAQRFQDPHSEHDALQLAWLQQAEPDAAAFWRQQPSEQAADNLSVGNTMTALRAMGDADWSDIVERSSTLMHMMCGAESFKSEAIVTRDQSLHAIERLARRSQHSEITVATALLALMRGHGDERAAASHWLSGPGQATLLRALGLDNRLAAARRAIRRHAVLPAYLAVLGFATVGLVAWMLPLGAAAAPSELGWLTLIGILLMVFPASEAVIALVNRLISESVRPRPLPRLALANGIPPEHRVMVVIPSIFSSLQGVAGLAHRLELHYLANSEPQAQFALLGDWPDADQQQTPADAGLLEAASAQLRTLNLRYPPLPGTAPRFLLLHRARQFSETEQRWIGWERKRGKLELLVHALASGSRAPFLDLAELSEIAPGTRYVMTLDSDTQLPPGCLRKLVGVAAHPHNQPRIDPVTGKVLHGYGILQPQIATPLPKRGDFTLFHWLFAGQSGIDPYSAASSEVYQDLFDEGSFSGKGLLQVQAMHAVLSTRLPSEQVLSHDLLEGAIARCATVSDIALIEDAPFHSDVAMSRIHRWIRGDWQLLPFVATPWHWRLGTINRWKMFDNLRRSLVAPMSLALLVLSMGGAIVSPREAIALVLAAFAAGPLLGAIAGFAPSRDDVAKMHFYQQAAVGLARVCGATVWQFAQLLQNAIMSADAVFRALYRMAVSRRHLLQWTTAEAAQARAQTALPALLRLHWRVPATAAVLLAGMLASPGALTWLACVISLLWAASPLWTWLVSRPHTALGGVDLKPDEREDLHAIAYATWGYFVRCVGASDNHLPPDNLQTTPHDMLAHRTSPTNIGLYLLSAACARAFGWIDTPQLLARLEATLATLQRLQRYRGHFLNWYDTQTCAPLAPLYVSTVDSGNLSGHLLAVAQACLELSTSLPQPHAADAADARRLQAMAQALEQLAWAPEFGFLYHQRRHLLHIGYRVQENEPDANFYDLLASECRLTSLLAIAKGDVPVRHWATLGRPFFAVGALAGLRSWSGSMFEYMMPTLVLQEPFGSVMDGACRAALHEQIAYARRQGVPWGMSESAYAASDHTLAYQYAAQGVPALALRRTPLDDLVIAPYATALAAQFSPRRALANFDALQVLVPRSTCGFIDALDYTPTHQGAGEVFTPVSTFMAHHQGMSLVALANVLLDGVARRWGMANTRIEAVASLLHERAPREVPPLRQAPQAERQTHRQRRRDTGMPRALAPGDAAVEPSHVLSNGRLSVTLRPNGAGWTRWGQTGIGRWRDDALRDPHGNFIYLRRIDPKQPVQPQKLVSLTRHPAPDPLARYQCTFLPDRVCFDVQWPQLHAHTTVWVSPEDDIEFRQVDLHNLGEQAIEIELLSAFEVTLADPRADESHPAFSNLFVSCAWQPAQQALVFTRTPRLATEQGLQAAHFLVDARAQVLQLRLQTDRQRWLGRNHAPGQPQGLVELPPQSEAAPSGRIGLNTELDPVSVLAVRVRIGPGAKAQLTFATAASADAGTLHAIIDKYRQASHVQRASLMSATLAGIRMRTMRMSARNLAAIQSLTTALLFGLARPPFHAGSTRADIGTGVSDKRVLWRLGISGDRPVVLVWATVVEGLNLLRVATQALRWWAWGGVACDLVVVNLEPASYQLELQRELAVLQERYAADTQGQAGAAQAQMHVLRGDALSTDEQTTLRRLARVQFHADGRPFSKLVDQWLAWHQQALAQRDARPATAVAPGAPQASPVSPTEGRFDTSSGEFRFDVGTSLRPVRPWINVLANPHFGGQLSESGGGYSWAVNSRLMQLTGWTNDPVQDPPAEWFLLQDRRTRQAWSVAPSAWGAPGVVYQVRHGQGNSTIRHRHLDIEVTASWCVDPVTSTKQIRLQLTNRGSSTAYLRLVGIAEWIMGGQRGDRHGTHTAGHATPERMTLLCTQTERSANFGGATAYLSVGLDAGEQAEWTCDRRELLDSHGALQLPQQLGQIEGAGLDPCAALALRIRIKPGATTQRVFLLGFGADPVAAQAGADAAGAITTDQRDASVREAWDTLLGAVQVTTPDPLFDVMVNRWLLYQNVACRMWAKAGFYQAGGATGFRDQLQDAMAMAWAAPRMLHQQILTAAARQFPQGDVQHWWHAPDGAGVRTRFSDDLLWLPFACLHHLQVSGESALLDELVPFIEGAAIAPGAEDAYYVPMESELQVSVFEHAARAIDHSLRVGVHGLPLMGSGDWNDGMNRVGIEGRGESVWLAWFLCTVVAGFAPLARGRGELTRADNWERAARGWQDALQGPGWDGSWYRRAFFDDGQVLGSASNTEARIDLIAQAWAVLSGQAPLQRARQAMTAVEQQLLDPAAGLVRLLDPPLQHQVPSAGYIQSYPPGVRENGGQYSHAGVWALMAQAELGLREPPDADAGDRVWRSFRWLNPAHRAADPVQGPLYGLEPYVMAGDVYSQPPYAGRGGWSWYTGSAGWMHRAAIESMFGLQLGPDTLRFTPCLPSHWPRAELVLTRDGRSLRFILWHGPAAEALAAVAVAGASLLRPGEPLQWTDLPSGACHVVPWGYADGP